MLPSENQEQKGMDTRRRDSVARLGLKISFDRMDIDNFVANPLNIIAEEREIPILPE